MRKKGAISYLWSSETTEAQDVASAVPARRVTRTQRVCGGERSGGREYQDAEGQEGKLVRSVGVTTHVGAIQERRNIAVSTVSDVVLSPERCAPRTSAKANTIRLEEGRGCR